jgi:IS6 family transposase
MGRRLLTASNRPKLRRILTYMLDANEFLSPYGIRSLSKYHLWRWVQAYAAELNRRCRPHLKATDKSYRVDETYIKVKGQEKYLYRAVDSTGQTIDFLLTAKRDAASAKRFFRRVFVLLIIQYRGSSMSIRIQLTPLLSER